MPVVTRKSSPPPASPHRHKGTGSVAAQGPRKQHGSGSAPSACDPLQGDDGHSDDMHAASLGLSRNDQNDQTCSTLEAMWQSHSDMLSKHLTAMLSGSTALSMLSVQMATANTYCLTRNTSVSTAVRVCVGGNRSHQVIWKYAHEMRENTSVRCKAVLQHSNMRGAQQSQTFLPSRKTEK